MTTPPSLLDRVERGVELRAALALERAEGLAGQALRVHAHERARLGEVARDDREVVGAGDAVLVGEERGTRRARSGTFASARRLTRRLWAAAWPRARAGSCSFEVRDELLDRDDGHAVALAELDEAGQAHHRAVLGDDLGDDADGLRARRAA